jgi:hypothetical protein
MAKNGISKFPTKEARQLAKLEMSGNKRQGLTVRADGAILGVQDSTRNFYRPNNYYDRTLLPTQYIDEVLIDNTTPLIVARPWLPLNDTATVTGTIRLEDENIITFEDGANAFSIE